MKSKQEHDFHDALKQGILQLLAKAFEDPTGMGFLKLYQVFVLLKTKKGSEPLKSFWGIDYKLNIKKISRLKESMKNLNLYFRPYIHPDNLKLLLNEEDVTSKRFQNGMFWLSECMKDIDVLFDAFVCLLEQTSIKDLDILHDYWNRGAKK